LVPGSRERIPRPPSPYSSPTSGVASRTVQVVDTAVRSGGPDTSADVGLKTDARTFHGDQDALAAAAAAAGKGSTIRVEIFVGDVVVTGEVHEGLWLRGTTERNCPKGEEDVEDGVVLCGRIPQDPGCETGVARKLFMWRCYSTERGIPCNGPGSGKGNASRHFVLAIAASYINSVRQLVYTVSAFAMSDYVFLREQGALGKRFNYVDTSNPSSFNPFHSPPVPSSFVISTSKHDRIPDSSGRQVTSVTPLRRLGQFIINYVKAESVVHSGWLPEQKSCDQVVSIEE
jgi:hypothetical protein